MNDIFVRDIVYDTMTHRFMHMTYTSKEKANKAILDGLGFLPIRKSEDGVCINIYKLKNDKRKIIKIRYSKDSFNNIDEYRDYIDSVLAANGRKRNDVSLIKKVVDTDLYKEFNALIRAGMKMRLLSVYNLFY